MRRKLTLTLFIFFSAFLLNISAMAFQQRYDRRDDEDQSGAHLIEMTDSQVLKYLKNTWYYDIPIGKDKDQFSKVFFVEESGFGHQVFIQAKPNETCQLKFVLINYLGFFHRMPANTFVV